MSIKNTVGKCLILGGSKGLGAALKGLIPDSVDYSRSTSVKVDLSKPHAVDQVLELVRAGNFSHIFYVAGGGPHGSFFEKPFQSHEWAYRVNFFTPIQICYELIDMGYQGEFIYIGSAIAERAKSISSLSYSSSKQMAKKALLSIPFSDLKTRVFSPPFMDTNLLPPKAWPRVEFENLVLDPKKVAEDCLKWISAQDGKPDQRHFDWIERFDYTLPENKDF